MSELLSFPWGTVWESSLSYVNFFWHGTCKEDFENDYQKKDGCLYSETAHRYVSLNA
jgi:hypothetical protein